MTMTRCCCFLKSTVHVHPLNVSMTLSFFLQVRSSGIRCTGMLGQLAHKSNPAFGTLWQSAWADIQPSVCACLLSFLEVTDFAPKVKWNTCSAVQRLLHWDSWDQHTMCVCDCNLFLLMCSVVHFEASRSIQNASWQRSLFHRCNRPALQGFYHFFCHIF